ncbi:MAG: phospholipid/cholesterol/gamma-HCH transport system substrate-binding protein [Actinomycetota bacterium]|nr:phospholipid/cholesterol/gamma-HCH transport system substrate-binding protein [Actinomycetota bacterium]
MTAPTKDLRPPLSPTRRRLSGLVLLLVMVLVVTGCLLNFNKVFKPVDMVTLQTDTVGNQLSKQGDVKVRGVIVGEIKSVESDGQRATIQMAMDPDALTAIPSNVTAMLVPKTLFGERFVSLNIPPNPTPRRLQEGDVITQDRSQNATETEQVLNNLLPVLSAVQPQKLSDTLGAISQALSGRGQQLGGTLVQLNQYLTGINPSLPDLLAVINRLSPTADIYNAATPDLIGALDNLVTTSQTLVQERAAFESTFRTVTSASNVTTDFLAANRNNIINLAATSLPVLDLLARYSPEFPCLLQQLTDVTPKINDVLKPTTGIQIAATISLPDRGKYTPADSPAYQDKRGPRCYIINGRAPQYPPEGPFKDGSFAPPPAAGPPVGVLPGGVVAASPAAATTTTGGAAAATGATTQGQGAAKIDAANIGLPDTPNSPEERTLVTTLTGMQMGLSPGQVPAFAPYLSAATMRGTTVEIS